ncbi:hypothetical protein GW750_07915 [bacterium]|nr:hypothetical protein [bacterium]
MNNADHTIVHAHKLKSTSGFVKANNDVNNSGALLHTAINVAQANSEESFNCFAIFSNAGTKTASQIIAKTPKLSISIHI